jgi:hypothetical protein
VERARALPGFTVSGLAGHLSRQIFHVRDAVAQDPADEPPITLLDHYARSRWAGAQLDDDVNVRIRRDGERTASEGPGALAAQAERPSTRCAARSRHSLPAGWCTCRGARGH